jgi:hypothetical protein
MDSCRGNKKITLPDLEFEPRLSRRASLLSLETLGWRATKRIATISNRLEDSEIQPRLSLPNTRSSTGPNMRSSTGLISKHPLLPVLRQKNCSADTEQGTETEGPISSASSDVKTNRVEEVRLKWRNQQIKNQANLSQDDTMTSWNSWQNLRRASLVMVRCKRWP